MGFRTLNSAKVTNIPHSIRLRNANIREPESSTIMATLLEKSPLILSHDWFSTGEHRPSH